LTCDDIEGVLRQATVPEHSVRFMQAMSGGEPLLEGGFLFFSAGDWLLAIGYPFDGTYVPEAFDQALHAAARRRRATDFWAICPALPERLEAHRCEQDRYYVLPLDGTVPARLERLAQKAAARLTVAEGQRFTAAHRRLWAEFLGRTPLPPRVRELYARTEAVLQGVPRLSLLDAWDREGNLAASLLLDAAPPSFTTYLLGAHSRHPYTPYATDLLFREMIRIARGQGKRFVHLGLGVNPGIRRFKAKWGGVPGPAYEMAEWQVRDRSGMVSDLMRSIVSLPRETMSKREYMARLPQQREFKMLWELEKHGRRSWIAGAAHFFCYSFEFSLRELFEQVDTVVFEGPLDEASLQQVSAIGRSPAVGSPRLIDAMTEVTIRRLERTVCGPSGWWARLLGFAEKSPADVRGYLAATRPWMAFFSLWTSYLARNGWAQSVDLEAWHLAREMDKRTVPLETIAEQIDVLESIPMARIVDFFRRAPQWDSYIRRNVRAYLKGDLEAMLGTSIEFPSRTEQVIGRRDAIFLERMRPLIAAGDCAVFVGSAHMLNLRRMLAEDGFSVRRRR
jgi:uncharacterized protein YbaP (TraB family)